MVFVWQRRGYVSLTSNIGFGFNVYSGIIKARVSKLVIRKDNGELHCKILTEAHCCYSSIYLSFVLSLQGKGGIKMGLFLHTTKFQFYLSDV